MVRKTREYLQVSVDRESAMNWTHLKSVLQTLTYHKSLEAERDEAMGANGKSNVQSQIVLGFKQSSREQIEFSNSQLQRILNVVASFPRLSTFLFFFFFGFIIFSTIGLVSQATKQFYI